MSQRATLRLQSDVKLLYVMGAGRSGSTLLDILLGSQASIVGTGELTRLVGAGWGDGEPCACGLSASRCPFWRGVRDRWDAQVGLDPTTEYLRLQRVMEKTGRMPWLWDRPRPGHRIADRYGLLTGALLRAIEPGGDCALIVDSSKNPGRALALSQLGGLDLYCVHLVRDSRAVAWSYAKHFARDPSAGIQTDQSAIAPWRSALRWVLINTQCESVRRRMPPDRSIRVRYEDFVSDPARTLQRIGRMVRLDLTSLSESLASGREIPVGHPVAGNRLRMQRAVRVAPDDAWRVHLNQGDRRVVSVLTWPMMRRYGYR